LTLSKRYLSYGPQDLQQFTGLHKGYISIKNSNYFKKKKFFIPNPSINQMSISDIITYRSGSDSTIHI
jgi:hypothetical protein